MNNTTIVTRSNIDSKSILARLLATENVIVEHDINSETAYFDTASRRLVLPVWNDMDNDTYDMLVGHEVGHALFTPAGAEPLLQAIDSIDSKNPDAVKGFLNVVEDARIERLMKRKYPGLAHNFRRAYTTMFANDQFGFRQRVQQPADLILIDRLNLRAKIGVHASVEVPLDADEQLVFDEMMQTETWEEVVDLTKRIYQMHKDRPSQQPKRVQVKPNTQGNGESPQGEGDSKDASRYLPNTGEHTDQVSDSVQAPVTDNAHKQINSKRENPDHNGPIVYLELPKTYNYHQHINTYKMILDDFPKIESTPAYEQFRNESRSYVNMLVKEFELQKAADVQSRTSIARSGVLDPDRLHQYKYVEDIFRRMTTVREGKNHGLVMFLDWSSSMAGVIQPTIKQVMLLAWFCRAANIPFDVYAFSNSSGFDSDDQPKSGSSSSELRIDRLTLHQFVSSRMTTNEFNRAMMIFHDITTIPHPHYPKYVLNSTPLLNTVAVARYIVDDFRRDNAVQVVNTVILTDGEDSDGLRTQGVHNIHGGYGGRAVIRDRATRCQIGFEHSESHSFRLSKMLQLLKTITDTNVVGFYLVASGGYGLKQIVCSMMHLNPHKNADSDRLDAVLSQYRTQKYLEVNTAGYDAFFVLPSDKMDTTIDAKDDYLTKTLTKGRIATAFLKTSQARQVNKVLIRRFINFISKD